MIENWYYSSKRFGGMGTSQIVVEASRNQITKQMKQ